MTRPACRRVVLGPLTEPILCLERPVGLRPALRAIQGHHCLTTQSFLSLFLPITDSEDDGESEAAKQLIQPIAEKIIAKYKAKEEEAPLLFFVAGEVSVEDSPGPWQGLVGGGPPGHEEAWLLEV